MSTKDELTYDSCTRLSTFYLMRWLFNKYGEKGDRYKLFNCTRATVDRIFRCHELSDKGMKSVAELADLTGLDKKYFTGINGSVDKTIGYYFIVPLTGDCNWEDYWKKRKEPPKKKNLTDLRKYEAKINISLENHDKENRGKRNEYNQLKYYIMYGHKEPSADFTENIQRLKRFVENMDKSPDEYFGIDVALLEEYKSILDEHLENVAAIIRLIKWKSK